MKESQLEKMSVTELKGLRSRIDKSMQSKQESECSALRERFKREAEQAGFTWSAIVGGARGRMRSPGSATYAHPDNPSLTWSGRGRMPKWLSEKVKAGADRNDFRISRA